jgi:hypothetical protein
VLRREKRIAMADSAAGDVKAEKAAANGSGGCDAGPAAGQGKKRADQAVAFHELFSFADKWDLALMALGSLGALAHGAAMPCFFLLFGDLINGFGKNQTDLRTMTDEVAKVRTTSPFLRCVHLRISPVIFLFAEITVVPPLISSLLYCSMRSTSSTSDWWSAPLPTQVSFSFLSSSPYFRKIPGTPLFSLFLRRTKALFNHSCNKQGPIRKMGSGHVRWGISETTTLTNTSPVAITK